MSPHQRRWADRRAKGLCGECGQVPSEMFSRCTLCRQFINDSRKRWWRRGAGRRLNRQKREAYAQDASVFKARAREYRHANPEKDRARNRAYYRAKRDWLLARQRAYYQRHRERELARAKAARERKKLAKAA